MKDYLSDPLDWSLPEIEQLRELFVLVYEDRGIAREFAYKAGLLRGTFTEATKTANPDERRQGRLWTI